MITKNRIQKTVLLTIISFLFSTPFTSLAQDNLSLDDIPAESSPVREAFNGSYVINNHSSNVLEGGRLNFLILHRFGEVSEGAYNAFGLDYASMRLGFEYGITDQLTAGIGRTSAGKNFDGYLKYRLLTQKNGPQPLPISVTVFSSIAFSSAELHRQNAVHDQDQFLNQLVYTTELIISRQFSEKFSFQIIPALIKRNSVNAADLDHNIYSLSGGGRLKLSNRIHLIGDYSYVFNKDNDTITDPLALGIDIVTGGHVFQVYVSNSAGMIEKEFLTATTGKIDQGNIRIGFTVSRSFILKSKVEGGKLK